MAAARGPPPRRFESPQPGWGLRSAAHECIVEESRQGVAKFVEVEPHHVRRQRLEPGAGLGEDRSRTAPITALEMKQRRRRLNQTLD
jgi:hypothetical protein